MDEFNSSLIKNDVDDVSEDDIATGISFTSVCSQQVLKESLLAMEEWLKSPEVRQCKVYSFGIPIFPSRKGSEHDEYAVLVRILLTESMPAGELYDKLKYIDNEGKKRSCFGRGGQSIIVVHNPMTTADKARDYMHHRVECVFDLGDFKVDSKTKPASKIT